MLSTAKRRRRPLTPSPHPGRALKIAVLMGGVGHEREVSLVSGREVADALERRGHTVHRCLLASSTERELAAALPSGIDLAFVALHGEFGEDGTVQHLLARLKVPYTGSGPEASARAYDKARAKRLLARAGLPLAAHRIVEFPFGERAIRHAVRMTPPGKVVVKPVRMGSSVGVTLCADGAQLRRALEEGARFRQDLMIEEFIPGHELTCGVLDGRALPVVEAVAERTFFDYQAKYDKSTGTRYRVDSPAVPAAVRARAQEAALTAHEVLGCEDFSRTDLRYDPRADRLAILEVNTIPGLTPTSLLPKAAAAIDLPFDALCERLCRLAIRGVVR